MTHRRELTASERAARARDLARRATAAAIGFIPVAIVIIEESKDYLPAELAAAALGALAVASRVLANPATLAWIAHYAPWLEPGEDSGGSTSRRYPVE